MRLDGILIVRFVFICLTLPSLLRLLRKLGLAVQPERVVHLVELMASRQAMATVLLLNLIFVILELLSFQR